MDLLAATSLYRAHCEEIGLPSKEPHGIDRESYWFFADQTPVIGRSGLIIRKQDGLLTVVGSALGHRREMIFWAYESGLLTGKCDLVITRITGDVNDVIDVLTKTPPSQRGMRLPGNGREKWRAALASLPAVAFAGANLYNYVHELWEARSHGTFSFEIRPVT